MDDDEKLISRLCVRAGMIMEDASLLAVTMPGEERERWLGTLEHLSGSLQTMRALIAAALALEQHVTR
jgi:hypothetical protein